MKTLTIERPREAVWMSGIVEPATGAMCAHLLHEFPAPVTIVLVGNQKEMEQRSDEIAFFAALGGSNPELQWLPPLPPRDPGDPRLFELECDRLAALTRLSDLRDETETDHSLIILTTPQGLFHPVPPRESLATSAVRLQAGQVLPFGSLVEQLNTRLSYDSEVLCETPGQYAVRGGLIDIYPVNADRPYRIDFFGDEIENIREFDPTTQRSHGSVEAIAISAMPVTGTLLRERYIFEYLGDKINWIVHEPSILAREHPTLFDETPEGTSHLVSIRDLVEHRDAFPDRWFGLAEIDADDPIFSGESPRQSIDLELLSNYRLLITGDEFGIDRHQAEQEARLEFLGKLAEWQDKGFAILCVAHNDAEEKRLREILDSIPDLARLAPSFLRGNLREGFRLRFNKNMGPPSWFPEANRAGVVVVSDSEIFGRYRLRPGGGRHRRLPRRAQVDQLLDFSELVKGDYVVHLQHGIARYQGLSKILMRGKNEDMLSLEFDDGIVLHLPLYESHLLTRYVGLTKIQPRLGRLGSNTWDKTRRAAEKATIDLAAELLEMQARRSITPGHAFSPDVDWQKDFEDAFIFRETPDQLSAIETVKKDLERARVTDRLICGDVGFGKTEVALRAAFKVVMDGKQVALLVPTTVLAQQHLNTFRERMADYPLVVEMLSRFRNRSQQSEILAQLRTGRIDVIIGTHRLLSRDVAFRDLGLLVIDEEHRFGVRHKERIKRLRKNVDVFTMSATPIPRTLYLALMGARDLSVIETPPVDRLPIQTLVKSYDPNLVKEAIRFETDRGGQVFYLHNRVQSIDSVAMRLREMMPDLKIAVGHGQMDESRLEDIMTRFVAGEFDVLVCTTIIESGLDIPNCNTIIIEEADRFGLSQLYQLRGRVGRFKRQAYAYLLLHRHTYLVDQARKRLAAIRHYNQLGAGFKIAMRDLELRGAGNILGSRQSGHIAGVGFELYCQLLRQSIARLKGQKGSQQIRAKVRLDFVNPGEGDAAPSATTKPGYAVLKEAELAGRRATSIAAFVPNFYITETRLRIDAYRRLALANDVAGVTSVAESLKDRFGAYPLEVKALLMVTEIRCHAEEKGVLSVLCEGDRLKCLRASGKADDYIKVGKLFPRLTHRDPILRLKEIRTFLNRQESIEN